MQNAVDIVAAVGFFGTLAITVKSITTIWAKRLDARGGLGSPRDAEQRLERIETAVDAIAVEVERISEAQRFTARLASERGSPRIPDDQSRPAAAAQR
jgi:hypothetical protein